MPETIIQKLKQKATLLNELSRDEAALFEYINTNHDNLAEVIQQYKPEIEFKPVNTLRFLIANELKKERVITKAFIAQLKKALEDRDVSEYYDLNDSVKQSLTNYKDSKIGMFPNWKHTFKILFPFIHNASENEEVKHQLNQLADKIIEVNQLEDVTKHIVSFQGAQNYGTDIVWLAIIPNSAPSVQYAYQIFLKIDVNGLSGGIHKGHNLTKQDYQNQDIPFNTWDNYLQQTKDNKKQWSELNSDVNFIFINDEKDFIKSIKKLEVPSLTNYFKTLDKLKDDLEIQDEEKLVFSLAKNRLSFQVRKRYCLNLSKDKLFDFISNADVESDNVDRETFSGEGSTYLYKKRKYEDVYNNYQEIKSAIENEIERDNHALAKFYDNSAFRKAFFELDYRKKVLEKAGMQDKYYLVGAYWDSHEPKDQTERFVNEGIWINGYDDKFNTIVKKVEIGSYIAIKTVDRKGNVLFIKAKGKVVENLNDGQNLKVEWDKDFKDFKVNFSGGYWDTIKQVKKKAHIDSIWSKKGSMENVKQEFIDWLMNKPKSNYFNNDNEILNRYLDNYNMFFNIDLFEVTKANYKAVIDTIHKVAYQDDTSAFFKFSVGESNHRARAILGKTNYYKFLEQKFNESVIEYEENSSYKPPLNQIFYGPPGTGKTYNTILEAAKIIEQNDSLKYSEAQTIFNENLRSQIEFITFHQNYSYEDFIQGLRPDIEQKALSFNRADGIFTKMVINALFEYYKVYQKNQKAIVSEEDSKIDLNDAFIEFLNSLEEGQEFETKTGSKIKVDNFTEKQNIEFRPLNGVKSYLVSGNRLLKLYDVFDDIDKIKRVHEDIRDAIGGCNSSIYYVALREFIEFLKIYKATATEFEDEDDAIDYDNITYRRKKELLSSVNSDDLCTVSEHAVPKYVIVIDEINRANISRVFGELITLIEKDKRSHGKIPLSATLPSGEKFIVPSNLHIIGTMNTADKSIALLDIALRRRFEFVSMYPDSNSTEGKIVNDAALLDAINKEIISRKGHDFTIGHSYFMGEDYDRKNTIDNKVIPLLLEYFMNDFEEVKKILGAANIKVDGWPMQYVAND